MSGYKPFSHKEAFAAGIAEPFQHHEMVAAGKAEPVGRDDYSAVSSGGSSDFSTAQVTINKTTSSAASFFASCIMSDSGYSGADDLSSGQVMTFSSKETVTIILYKGAAELKPSSTGSISNVIGDAVVDNDVLIVKGDCEFTLINQ